MKAPVTKREAVERIAELEEIVAGAQAKEELLLDYIDNMCGMIEYRVPIKEHDRWLADVKAMGWYKNEEEVK